MKREARKSTDRWILIWVAGRNPVEAVQWLDRIARATEASIPHSSSGERLPQLAAHAYISSAYAPVQKVQPTPGALDRAKPGCWVCCSVPCLVVLLYEEHAAAAFCHVWF